MSLKKEFGDFQTPLDLARQVVTLLYDGDRRFRTIIEPTCGIGAFLQAAGERFGDSVRYLGFDVNADYVQAASGTISQMRMPDARVQQQDFYTLDWKHLLNNQTEPVLVLGNPPWVTNSGMSVISGSNLPVKRNAQGHSGFDAITGKSNFDISEWMLIQLMQALNKRDATLAMLVKTVVARKALLHAWRQDLQVAESCLFQIDAMKHFDAAVDASLLVIRFGKRRGPKSAAVHATLSETSPPVATLGFADNSLVADLDAFESTRHIAGTSGLKWRSGIKHDCAKVMELHCDGDCFRNGLGESVELESDYLYPMLKTSDVAKGRVTRCDRYMLVPQRRLGEDTAEIERHAPRTWRYLCTHQAAFAKRGSSIYRGKPNFSVFGVGEYTFSPWKVAISGMYKTLRFNKVGPCKRRPVVFDDVTNFLPCPSEAAADLLLELLSTPHANAFFRGRVFWDAKRPITVDLLNKLDFERLAAACELTARFVALFPPETTVQKPSSRRRGASAESPMLW